MNDCHSQFVIYVKRTNERCERISLSCIATWIKILRVRFPWYDVFLSRILKFVLTDRHTSRIGSHLLPSTVKYHCSCFWLNERCVFTVLSVHYAWNKTSFGICCLLLNITLTAIKKAFLTQRPLLLNFIFYYN